MSLLELPRELLCEYLDTYSLAHLSFTCTAAVAALSGVCGVKCDEKSITFVSARGETKQHIIVSGMYVIPSRYDIGGMYSTLTDGVSMTGVQFIVKYREMYLGSAENMRTLLFCGKVFGKIWNVVGTVNLHQDEKICMADIKIPGHKIISIRGHNFIVRDI